MRTDVAVTGGLALAVGGILAGLLLEGGTLQDVAQISAALIVFAGTCGAVMVTTPLPILSRAIQQLPRVLRAETDSLPERVDEMLTLAAQARRFGTVSLEPRAKTIADPFLRKALELAVDGVDASGIREIMETEIELFEQNADAEAKVFEAAGGYAPTMGIIGAVLGLIQAVKNLANMDAVGRGIAVAFVATIYGVGSANLIFLPVAARLRARAQATARKHELTLQGVLAIAKSVNPWLVRSNLEAFLGTSPSAASAAQSPEIAAAVTAKG